MSPKSIISIMLLSIALMLYPAVTTKTSYKPLQFSNPGNKKLLKTETSKVYYYTSLPEKTMRIDTKDIDVLQIRAISVKKLAKPQFTVIINKTKTTYPLAEESNNAVVIYKPIEIKLPANQGFVELLCYDNNIYFRGYKVITKTIQIKPIHPLQIIQQGGIIDIKSNSHSTKYYVFNNDTALKFNVNNQRKVNLYVRAQLTQKTVPVFELYKNGSLVDRIELTTKTSNKYTAEGINHLTVGKKIVLQGDSHTTYEVRAATNHQFFAHPSLIKE